MTDRLASIRRPFEQGVQFIADMSETRENHYAGLACDVLISLVLLSIGLRRAEAHPALAVATLLAGVLLFTLIEYSFHRWLFHKPVPLFEPGHRKHHQDPLGHDSLPFFLPPVLVLMLAGLFALALPEAYALLLAGGIAAGYAAYGLSHVVIHATRFRHPLARRWAASHHVHHYHPDCNFGVTTPLWDILLGTRRVRPRQGNAPKDQASRDKQVA
jgi:sterol desaturase/sphingolipid hydroxylase (fatty acid hydroxylase superfamily)